MKTALYELIFTADGRVNLYQARPRKRLWSSDEDDEFMEAMEDDFFDEEDEEDIIDWLIDLELIQEDDTIDIVVENLEDEDTDDEPIEGELMPREH